MDRGSSSRRQGWISRAFGAKLSYRNHRNTRADIRRRCLRRASMSCERLAPNKQFAGHAAHIGLVPNGMPITIWPWASTGAAMNLEKFTDRARGFLQSAQTVAIADEPSADHAGARAEGPARGRAGHGGRADRARRRQRRGGAARDRRGACQDPGRLRQRRQRGAGARRRDDPGARPGRADRAEGGRLLCHGRAAAARVGPLQDRRRQGARRRGAEARSAQRRDQRIARRPHRRHPERRGPLRRAEEIREGPHAGRA